MKTLTLILLVLNMGCALKKPARNTASAVAETDGCTVLSVSLGSPPAPMSRAFYGSSLPRPFWIVTLRCQRHAATSLVTAEYTDWRTGSNEPPSVGQYLPSMDGRDAIGRIEAICTPCVMRQTSYEIRLVDPDFKNVGELFVTEEHLAAQGASQ